MMPQYVEILWQRDGSKHRLLNGLLAVLTGIFALIWPDFLYMIAGGYLIATGLVFMAFRFNSFLVAATMLAGIFIFVFPKLIPFGFAFFLLILGIISLMSGGLSFVGVLALAVAVLLLSVPGFIAYIVAGFLLLYGIKNLVELVQRGTA